MAVVVSVVGGLVSFVGGEVSFVVGVVAGVELISDVSGSIVVLSSGRDDRVSPQPMSSNLMAISSCQVRGWMRMILVSTGGSIMTVCEILWLVGPGNTCWYLVVGYEYGSNIYKGQHKMSKRVIVLLFFQFKFISFFHRRLKINVFKPLVPRGNPRPASGCLHRLHRALGR